MFVLQKKLSDLTEGDIQELINNSISEGKNIDFKRDIYGNSDSDKKELLKDVSSFANTSGGEIIIGVNEEESVANEICPISRNPDEEIARLENIIRSSLNPRLPSTEIKDVSVEGGFVLVIRIAKSWLAPHMVTYKNNSKFYGRTSNGSFQLDVNELRTAFTLSETINERIRNFRSERIIKLAANETPVPFEEGAKIILHLVPITAFNAEEKYDIFSTYKLENKLDIIYSNYFAKLINIDGVLWYHSITYGQGNDSTKSQSYAQIYHNGVIESVSHNLIPPRRSSIHVCSPLFEQEVFKVIASYIKNYKNIGISSPFYVFLTFTGIKSYTLLVNSNESEPIDRDVLVFSEVLVEDFDAPVSTFMKPVIDQVHNAFGSLGSPNYDENGIWSGPDYTS